MIVVAVVDADNDAHGKYLLSFQNLSGIYNKRRGRICLPRRNFPSEIAAVLSVKTGDRLSKPYRPAVKIHVATKKRILLFGRMRAKSLVDIFRQMG